VIYDRNAGYKGKQQGDINERNPAPNAKSKLISDIMHNSRNMYLLHSIKLLPFYPYETMTPLCPTFNVASINIIYGIKNVLIKRFGNFL
jgi:hypothetical protein